ncbi:UNKNOWN [Stylonychia lemnae]|uniref:Uncharacterized protein n=1 Tax=Stylonychia lemnae TaxID=5949 RepID=A0A078A9E3_STYLE|nr:UNKNOWN [Stylonychia lemnae]|eukprot:CDW78476.1 UNKNOWN [Stylonychia lemnae]
MSFRIDPDVFEANWHSAQYHNEYFGSTYVRSDDQITILMRFNSYKLGRLTDIEGIFANIQGNACPKVQ